MIWIVHIRLILPVTAMLLAVFLGACSSAPDEALKVRQFHLRDIDPADRKKAQMVRGEQMYRMKGAVTMEQRESKLGDYYAVTWKALGAQPTRLVMDFNQAGTGAELKRMQRDLPVGVAGGKVEFKVTGDAYHQGGRVLAWRIRLMQGSRILAEKRSYLWR